MQDTVQYLHQLAAELDRPVKLMEVCGTHTVALFRTGVRGQLPDNVKLISGPGCPVCVTPAGYIDLACQLARRPGVTICSYGDMLRVPGTQGSLAQCRAEGCDVRLVYSARDALIFARKHPEREVIFLGVGFETTTPATAIAVQQAQKLGLTNFSVLDAHKLVIPALRALLADPESQIDAFLLPGHVSVIIGADAYIPVLDEFRIAGVIAGFEAAQMLRGICRLLEMLRHGETGLDNVYRQVVSNQGNQLAWQIIEETFEVTDAPWRALGVIPESGLALRPAFAAFDAWKRYGVTLPEEPPPKGCRCGDVIQGKLQPNQCPMFGKACTPRMPMGPCMVSSEGSCSAYYRYGNFTAQNANLQEQPRTN